MNISQLQEHHKEMLKINGHAPAKIKLHLHNIQGILRDENTIKTAKSIGWENYEILLQAASQPKSFVNILEKFFRLLEMPMIVEIS